MANTITGSLGLQTQLNFVPGVVAGSSQWTMPQLPPTPIGTGTGAGQANLIGLASGTATAAPSSVDLTAMTDPNGVTGVSFTMISWLLILNLNFVDNKFLLWDGSVTNAFNGPMNNIATAKRVIQAGVTLGGINYAGYDVVPASNVTGYTVSTTKKIISLDPGAATIPWLVYAIGH